MLYRYKTSTTFNQHCNQTRSMLCIISITKPHHRLGQLTSSILTLNKSFYCFYDICSNLMIKSCTQIQKCLIQTFAAYKTVQFEPFLTFYRVVKISEAGTLYSMVRRAWVRIPDLEIFSDYKLTLTFEGTLDKIKANRLTTNITRSLILFQSHLLSRFFPNRN